VLSAWLDTWLDPEFSGWNLDEDMRRVRCPMLSIHGDSDEFGSVRHPQRIAELTSGRATVEILTECGHVPHRERSDDVIDIVNEWLNRVGMCQDIERRGDR
jgi:pimeloyl-ACP methyl ester carboxylesterase